MHTPGLMRLLLSHSSLPRASLGGGRAQCGPRIAALHVACELLAKHAGAAVRASRWQLADRHLGDAVADRLVGKQRAADGAVGGARLTGVPMRSETVSAEDVAMCALLHLRIWDG